MSGSHDLSRALEQLTSPIFAVIDGAHFEDLEDELADLGISSRSLFLRGGDETMRRDGPWLLALDDEATRSHVIELATEKPCAVFWSWSGGENALWRHLRSINQILVPDDRIPGNDGSYGKPVKYERVLFRHWDPNVLAQMLGQMTTEEFVRFLGSAAAVCFTPNSDWADGKGTMRALCLDNKILANNGPLKLSIETTHGIKDDRANHSKRRIVSYLRKTAPRQTDLLDDRELEVAATSYIRVC